MSDMTVKSNRHSRPLLSLSELPAGVHASEFDYVDAEALATTGEDYSPRFFCYRGSWYDTHEFEAAPDSYRARGWDAVQTESYFSAVVLTWFDREGYEYGDAVVVGYAHW